MLMSDKLCATKLEGCLPRTKFKANIENNHNVLDFYGKNSKLGSDYWPLQKRLGTYCRSEFLNFIDWKKLFLPHERAPQKLLPYQLCACSVELELNKKLMEIVNIRHYRVETVRDAFSEKETFMWKFLDF